MIRSATPRDVDALLGIELRCFDSDRLSRRSFRHMLGKAHATLLVDEADGVVRGYSLVLYNRGTALARLYSMAVLPEFRGRGVARQLLAAAEQACLECGYAWLRLEVRRDNRDAHRLYGHCGYREFGVLRDYYEDHEDAVRYEKPLAPHRRLLVDRVKVPYYEQTLDFTCGPAALMMAMRALEPALEMTRRLELRIWREATTVFMTSGHGGCGPYGLALAAHHRGFGVEIYVSEEGVMFVDSVRSEEKKEVIRLVQEDFLEEIRRQPITLQYSPVSVTELKEAMDAGGVPVVLMSAYGIYREKFPHWVVVTGSDEGFVYVHDPYVDKKKDSDKTRTDCVDIPISRREFERMARYGRRGQRAVLIIRRRAD